MPRSPITRSESRRLVRSGANACRIPLSSAPCRTTWQGAPSSGCPRDASDASSTWEAGATPPGESVIPTRAGNTPQ
uniref:Uncharacterized protein n=1 Tax=Human herpesvirus 1 TaxID=10298 RepID=A0A2Z4H8N7_HHV1|nr:hypothetical protein [Human alphaherpesvirus 1]